MYINLPDIQNEQTTTIHSNYAPQRPKLSSTRSRGRSITQIPTSSTPDADVQFSLQQQPLLAAADNESSAEGSQSGRPRANSTQSKLNQTKFSARNRSHSLELSPPLEAPIISVKTSKVRPSINIENIPLSPIHSPLNSPSSPQIPDPYPIRPKLKDSLPALAKLAAIFVLSTAFMFMALSSVKQLHVPQKLTDVRKLAFDLRAYMTLSSLNSLHVLGVIGLMYVWKQTWSIPGSAIVNVILGALLPTWIATAYACLLTAFGGFLSSFTALPVAPHIHYHFPNAINNLRSINKDPFRLFERLLIARLIPVIPYAVLNLAGGVVGVSYVPFVVSLFLGSIPMNGVACAVGDVLVSLAYFTMAEASKKVKLDGQSSKTIGTHNGVFHADEALAVFLLRLLPEYKASRRFCRKLLYQLTTNAAVTRTRDINILNQMDIVVDVGDVYDHDKKRYDHHYRGFNEVFGHNHNTKLSSAGLIYKHYGKKIISGHLGWNEDEERTLQIWLKVYREFIEALDAIDNGVSLYPTVENLPEAAYRNRTDLSSRVGKLNSNWNEEFTEQSQMVRFEEASKLTGKEFLESVDQYAKVWLPARDIVVDALSKRNQVDDSGKIILFETFCPWIDHYFELEHLDQFQIKQGEEPLYALLPDGSKGWRVRGIPPNSTTFALRKPLPEPWRGLRDEKLAEVSGVPGTIFCHASGFIGGNDTFEGALEMARKAVQF
ncbi:hypothetical protein E3P89_02353 [Wallemia ichthyophaga]|uniref:VTT domain-containing protein n=1 Tax=Wallemia ichthyophaga TaxID=245174 RepID=A0A4T0JC53_WALIC|nr:hypothetical protein E3P90_03740 [Wallemia ichthyophaga]TIB12221.1 hypothetical protein E3P93_02372 [Wallemia ichthyophaga]TIB21928.1 hypothetical protein E3P89_02353 [Wallemia ichthyophaga]TIB23625.1 hypothetical protein E3P88_02444 [Wallemia ichthyophaga]TIB30650.1 hypothetical protein E3P84_03279 [Wallemia ichthyophaga]